MRRADGSVGGAWQDVVDKDLSDVWAAAPRAAKIADAAGVDPAKFAGDGQFLPRNILAKLLKSRICASGTRLASSAAGRQQ
jgi:hypothetical protein